MEAERRRQVQELLADALEQPESERAEFLTRQCDDDPELRAEVESLLRAEVESLLRVSAEAEAIRPRGDQDPHVVLHEAIGARYRLESLLDQGGMGLVYLAVDRKHGRRVAIKIVQPELHRGFAASERFKREIRITAGLQHPHILPLLDSGMAGDLLYYIMPYVEGESLKERLDRLGRLPAGDAVRLAIDVADGLAHAHSRGVLHRDIKPSNILFTDGHVQIVDFGIARAVVELDEEDLTASGLGIGTPAYMAPEQFGGEPTPRSDVYSLGAVLYEALTGRSWVSEMREGEPSWRHVPEGLVPILARALRAAPGERWPQVAEFCRALQAWERGQAAGASAATATRSLRHRLLSRVRRHVAGRPEPRVDRKSIAVLPFENLNRDEETEYFSDGITEDIIAHLSRIHELKVISRTSVMRYKGSERSMRDIGRELGVATVLEGSVRRVEKRVRVVSQLIDANTDQHLWSETFDRQLTHVFEIQSEVAQRIAHALEARITDAERSLIRRRPTEDVEAHDLYLRGRHLWNRRTQVALESAEEQFKRAVARDALFAPAYAGLADVYLLLGSYGYRNEIEMLRKTRTAVERALELDDRLAEAHASHAQVFRSEREWTAEELEYRRAIELNPNYATAHQWYATLLCSQGRQDAALREISAALELDPLSHAIWVTSGIIRFMGRDFEGSLRDLRRTSELEPRFFSAYAWQVPLWTQLGEYDRALEAWERMRELHPNPRVANFSRSMVLAKRGDREEALAIVEEKPGQVADRIWAGIVRAQLGDIDEAFKLLEEGLDDRSWRLFVLHRSLLFYLKVGPWFDALREDPRFEGLLRRMKMAS